MIRTMADIKRVVSTHKADKELGAAIARNIRARRRELGMTQSELARLTDKLQPHIARLERSTYGRHTIHSLNRLAVALGTTVSDLVSLDRTSDTKRANPPISTPRRPHE